MTKRERESEGEAELCEAARQLREAACDTDDEWELQSEYDFVMKTFDDALDPFEYFYWPTFGLPPRVRTVLAGIEKNDMRIHPACIHTINGACHAFNTLLKRRAGECLERDLDNRPKLPSDWKERRTEIEAHWPMRAMLIQLVGERLQMMVDGDCVFLSRDQKFNTSGFMGNFETPPASSYLPD